LKPHIDIAAVCRELCTRYYPHNSSIQDQIRSGKLDYQFDVYYAILGAKALLAELKRQQIISDAVEIVDNSRFSDDIGL
jgi:hypothetical protein